MCPFDGATLLGKYLITSYTVSPGHYWKDPFLIALIHVDFTGLDAATWRHLTGSVWFFMWHLLLILCSISLSRYELFFSKGTLHNPVYLSLVPVKSFFLLCDVDFFCVKTSLHPACHIFLV